ncbi:hypothetical protein LDG_8939 [Legionella drancourtii LLAP12]|uniref:Uncharacterized protein n=1 Tax=Legionella drancourtii LLAP12 TaxID=658187 RepID=G9EUE5_9GAMM|nr:hypothetical protein LDG_8939 [Legionella drancourtii LLAP12]
MIILQSIFTALFFKFKQKEQIKTIFKFKLLGGKMHSIINVLIGLWLSFI